MVSLWPTEVMPYAPPPERYPRRHSGSYAAAAPQAVEFLLIFTAIAPGSATEQQQ